MSAFACAIGATRPSAFARIIATRRGSTRASMRRPRSRFARYRGMSFEIGDAAPTFTLLDTEGVEHSLPADPAPAATVVILMCNHCPFVQAWNPRVAKVAREYAPRGVRFLSINSNDAERFPADSYDRMVQFARDSEWPMPYLHDPTQDVARALDGQVTPHLFVLDQDHTLVWTGSPDSDPGDESDEENAEWLREALESVVAGCKPAIEQRPLRGCSVKWKP